MSYYGAWPVYKIQNFRGAGELVWKAARFSWRVDRIVLPILLPTLGFLYYFSDKMPFIQKERSNPYSEACLKKKEEGKYSGVLIGLRPEKYI